MRVGDEVTATFTTKVVDIVGDLVGVMTPATKNGAREIWLESKNLTEAKISTTVDNMTDQVAHLRAEIQRRIALCEAAREYLEWVPLYDDWEQDWAEARADFAFIAPHSPSFMLGVYRQHLDVLDRHRYHCLNTYCDRCASKPCVEVASLLVLYRDVQERPRCPHIDPDRGQCWIEDKPHPRHIYTGEFFGTDVQEGAEKQEGAALSEVNEWACPSCGGLYVVTDEQIATHLRLCTPLEDLEGAENE